MKTEILNNNLLNAVKDRIPQGENLANTLMDVLFIGKEAVYRRLRGEVPFTFLEVATISKQFGVSLDKVVGTSSPDNALFEITQIQYADPMENDYILFENSLRDLRNVNQDPESEIGSSSNMLPHSFSLKYENLSKVRSFKWMYQSVKLDEVKPFHEVYIPEKLKKIKSEFIKEIQNVHNTFYIWDNMVFQNIVNDIRYFAGIQLILPKDVEKMKEELYMLIDDLENITSKGKYDDTGNKVHIYISDVNFETTYSYIQSRNNNFSLIRAFALNAIASNDEKMFKNLKRWIQSLKRFSVLISESGELQRVKFLKKQREIVEML